MAGLVRTTEALLGASAQVTLRNDKVLRDAHFLKISVAAEKSCAVRAVPEGPRLAAFLREKRSEGYARCQSEWSSLWQARVKACPLRHYELKETPPAWADRQGERLPPALADAAARLWQRAPHEHAAAAALGLATRRALGRIVLRASATQSLKGILTAGVARALQYLGEKVSKRFK